MKRRLAFFVAVFAAFPRPATVQPVGGEFQINAYATGNQGRPRIAARPNGGFVVVWHSPQERGPDAPAGIVGGGTNGIFARLFDPAGRPLGREFPVNEFTTGWQSRPSVAVAPNGEFVVVWSGYGDGGTGSYSYYPGVKLGGYGIFARQFAADGTPLGGEFQVNTYTTNYQGPNPSVAMNENGDFVVAWKSGYYRDAAPQDGDGFGVFARKFAAWGTPFGDEFQVNTYTPGYQAAPSVAMAANGDFTVVWQSPQDGWANGVFGQRFDADALPLGEEFQVNTYTGGNQSGPWIASASNGDFVVAWTSRGVGVAGQDGSFNGVFGRRFGASATPLSPEFRVNTYTAANQSGPCVAMTPKGDFVITWTSLPALPQAPYAQDGSLSGVFGQAFGATGARLGAE